MNHNIARQFLQSLEMVPKSLLDEMALFHTCCADLFLEQLSRRRGNVS